MKPTQKHAFAILTYYGLTEVGEKEVEYININFDETYRKKLQELIVDEKIPDSYRKTKAIVETTSELYWSSAKVLSSSEGIVAQLREIRRRKFEKAHGKQKMNPTLLEIIVNDPRYNKKLPI